MKKELIVKEEPKSPISEVFRTLRTNIQFMNNRKKLQTLLITSTVAGEGKSWISANLATTFAQAGKKVIILDADMRKGRQYTIFGISPKPGLSNYLSGLTDDGKELKLQDYIQETEIPNLSVITAGNIPPNPAELLVSENMINLLEKLKEICDIVIVDGPPTQLVTDSLILTRIVDSTVIVASSNHTKKESLRRVIDNIQKIGGQIAGVVINKLQVSNKKYQQSYYYSSTENLKKKNKKKKSKKSNEDRAQKIEVRNKIRFDNLENKIADLYEEKKKNEMSENYVEQEEKKVAENYAEQEEKKIAEPYIEQVETATNQPQKTELYKEIEKKENLDVMQKTEDIIKQINNYLENEKKNLA